MSKNTPLIPYVLYRSDVRLPLSVCFYRLWRPPAVSRSHRIESDVRCGHSSALVADVSRMSLLGCHSLDSNLNSRECLSMVKLDKSTSTARIVKRTPDSQGSSVKTIAYYRNQRKIHPKNRSVTSTTHPKTHDQGDILTSHWQP